MLEVARTTRVKKQIDPQTFYPVENAAKWLNIKASTVKQYLRSGRLDGEKQETVGFREEWRVLGSSIIELRKQMGIEK
jgi:hypothetical protein